MPDQGVETQPVDGIVERLKALLQYGGILADCTPFAAGNPVVGHRLGDGVHQALAGIVQIAPDMGHFAGCALQSVGEVPAIGCDFGLLLKRCPH